MQFSIVACQNLLFFRHQIYLHLQFLRDHYVTSQRQQCFISFCTPAVVYKLGKIKNYLHEHASRSSLTILMYIQVVIMVDVHTIQTTSEVFDLYLKQKSEFHFQQKSDNDFIVFLLDTAVRVISIGK